MANLSKNATKVLEKRYLLKDEKGKIIETPLEMFKRVAKHLAKAEDYYQTPKTHKEKIKNAFFEIMANLEYLPNSPTFSGAGTRVGQLSACFVLPIEDDMVMLNFHHTDIIKFIEYKNKEGQLNNFNISVALTYEFMEAVKQDKKYPLINPNGDKLVKKIKARYVFKKII